MSRAFFVSTVSRIFCGLVFLIHGTPKLFNLEGTTNVFENVGVPGWLAIPVALLEFFGGIFLILGFLTRFLAVLFIAEMVGAILFVHLGSGWDVFEGGFEYNVALVILLASVFLLGPSRASIDDLVGRGRKRTDGERIDDTA